MEAVQPSQESLVTRHGTACTKALSFVNRKTGSTIATARKANGRHHQGVVLAIGTEACTSG